jgi:hypothetical protein
MDDQTRATAGSGRRTENFTFGHGPERLPRGSSMGRCLKAAHIPAIARGRLAITTLVPEEYDRRLADVRLMPCLKTCKCPALESEVFFPKHCPPED